MTRKDLEFFRIFVELFVFLIDSSAYSPQKCQTKPVYKIYLLVRIFLGVKTPPSNTGAGGWSQDSPMNSSLKSFCPKPKKLYQLSGDDFTDESMTNTNNSANIPENFEALFRHVY